MYLWPGRFMCSLFPFFSWKDSLTWRSYFKTCRSYSTSWPSRSGMTKLLLEDKVWLDVGRNFSILKASEQWKKLSGEAVSLCPSKKYSRSGWMKSWAVRVQIQWCPRSKMLYLPARPSHLDKHLLYAFWKPFNFFLKWNRNNKTTERSVFHQNFLAMNT